MRIGVFDSGVGGEAVARDLAIAFANADVITVDDRTHVPYGNRPAEEIIKLTGSGTKVIYKPLPTDDPKQRKPDITRAKEILGWEPKVDRAEGLKITYDYFKSLPEHSITPKEFDAQNK